MPPRPGDTTRYYVVPASLQMGWKNSPAYFCSITDLVRKLISRLLATTLTTGIKEPHRHDKPALQTSLAEPADWQLPEDMVVELQVFVDDFMNGVAGPPGRASKAKELTWVNRAAMHAIHSVFPPPEVIGHDGGKDSISEKKVKKGDATFTPQKELLGKWFVGKPGKDRTVGLPGDKKDKYVHTVQAALDSPAFRVGYKQYMKVLGQLQYAGEVMPSMKGHFTPLNKVLAGKQLGHFIGLGKKSEVRETLQDMQDLLQLTHDKPSHISELVPPDLPHYYGTVDAASIGFGGVILPCTEWLQPTVWRVEMPADLKRAVIEGRLTMVDCEFAGYFIANCHLHDLLEGEGQRPAGMSSHFYSDNSPTVAIVGRQATSAQSPMPSRTLRWMARRQRYYRTGPQTVQHWPGKQNTMADIPSRSYAEGFPRGRDNEFLQHFSSTFPLPTQLGSWWLVQPRKEICLAAFSLLRRTSDSPTQRAARSGGFGANLPTALTKTLTSPACREPTDIWNASTCSWPLLLPCGTVVSTAESPLPGRPLRERYVLAGKSWQREDLQTLADSISPKPN